MVTKSITLDKGAYDLLKRAKRHNESFSDVVRRLTGTQLRLSDYAGAWADITPTRRRELDGIYARLRDADRRDAESFSRYWKRRRAS